MTYSIVTNKVMAKHFV